MASVKTCSSCKKSLPTDCFGKASARPDGLNGRCKPCQNESTRKSRERRRARSSTVEVPSEKRCSGCSVVKASADFVRDRNAASGLASWCKQCTYAATADWRSRNADRVLDYSRDYYRDNHQLISERRALSYQENAEEMRARSRAWAAANPEKAAMRNPEVVTRYVAKRRALKTAAYVEDVTDAGLFERYGHFCYLCESAIAPGDKWQRDHVQPLSRGGLESYENIRPTHARCNLSKSDKTLDELDLPLVPPHLLAVI